MTQAETTTSAGQEDDLLDSTSLTALYGGPQGLTHEEMVGALEDLATLLRDNPHSFLGHIHSLADNYLTRAYRSETGNAPDKSKMILDDAPLEVKPLLVHAVGEVAERNPFEAALHFLPLPSARTLREKYGSADETKGLTAGQIQTAVAPLVPIAEQAKVRMFLGVLAESLIRLEYRMAGFTIASTPEQPTAPQRNGRRRASAIPGK